MADMMSMPLESRPRRLHRRIVERFVITGTLQLETPAHFGNGETDALTDMPLLKDELDGTKPLLPGTSIAGALRNYLRERELGYEAPPPQPPRDNSKKEKDRFKAEQERERNLAASLLFGGSRGDEDGNQSPLIVHDALCEKPTDYELRDGVRIELETRTAEDEMKYDMTLLAAGSTFDLRFDLLISLPDGYDDLTSTTCRAQFEVERAALLRALATALDGLAKGEITLGTRKRRGFGRCSVEAWTIRRYDLTTRPGLLAWLTEGREGWAAAVEAKTHTEIKEALGSNISLISDARKRFTLNATFSIDGSLMVRSGLADSGPDMVHLHSPRPNQRGGMTRRPILAGTSWAGVLRSRSTQIAYTLAPQEKVKERDDRVAQLIDGIFGPAEITTETEEAKASRIEIAESEIDFRRVKSLEQTRIKIDPFTGGAFESALFSEQPLFGSKDSCLTLALSLRLPIELSRERQRAEIGLLLLLLKDLWTGDLPLGGEVGIGRGRLRGVVAQINYDGRIWQLAQADNGSIIVTEGDRTELQSFVEMLREELCYVGTDATESTH